jgi:hypothetical protein
LMAAAATLRTFDPKACLAACVAITVWEEMHDPWHLLGLSPPNPRVHMPDG